MSRPLDEKLNQRKVEIKSGHTVALFKFTDSFIRRCAKKCEKTALQEELENIISLRFPSNRQPFQHNSYKNDETNNTTSEWGKRGNRQKLDILSWNSAKKLIIKTERDNSRDAFYSGRVCPITGSRDNVVLRNPVACKIKSPETLFYHLKLDVVGNRKVKQSYPEYSTKNVAAVLIMGKCFWCCCYCVSLFNQTATITRGKLLWNREKHSASHPRCSAK